MQKMHHLQLGLDAPCVARQDARPLEFLRLCYTGLCSQRNTSPPQHKALSALQALPAAVAAIPAMRVKRIDAKECMGYVKR